MIPKTSRPVTRGTTMHAWPGGKSSTPSNGSPSPWVCSCSVKTRQRRSSMAIRIEGKASSRSLCPRTAGLTSGPRAARARSSSPSSSKTTARSYGAMRPSHSLSFTALDAPFDRYLAGDPAALSDAQKRGALRFYRRESCSSCHRGGKPTDFGFHNVATPQVGTGKGDEAPLDYGRGGETGKVDDSYRFRTPALRDIELEGPWMYNGVFATLEATVRHHLNPAASLGAYDDGQVEPEREGTYQDDRAIIDELLDTVDPELAPEGDPLTDAEVADLMAFL
ncbi:hypothetical protein WMF14_27265 [Sorangium sp. So ce693]